jgi:hypothetical protein
MNLQEWVEEYKPIMHENGGIYGFETYGDWEKFVSEQGNRQVWTLIDTGVDDEMIIVAGKRWVNRQNYFITENEWVDNDEYVELSDDDEIDIYFSL